MKQPVTPRGKWAPVIDNTVCAATRSLRRKRDFIQEIKMEKGCECFTCKWSGEFTPEMLAFDHIDPASKHARLRNKNCGFVSLSWQDLITEISKCRVVCHNCHFKHTIAEGHHKNYLEN
jgi:hypothetical protein